MLTACVFLLATGTVPTAGPLVYCASLTSDGTVRIAERSLRGDALHEEYFVVTAKGPRPFRHDFALNATGDRLYLHLEFDKGGTLKLRSTTYVLSTTPLKVIGVFEADPANTSPRWVSSRSLAYQSLWREDPQVMIVESSSGLRTTTVDRIPSTGLTSEQVAEVLAVLSRQKAKPPPRLHGWPEFVTGHVSAVKGAVAVSADRSRIVFHGVIEPQFTDGASTVFVMNKIEGWKPNAIATFQNCESVLVRGNYVIVQFRDGDETWATLFSIGEQRWRSLGKLLGADIAAG